MKSCINNIPHMKSTNIKFTCSYGGKILPRQSDGKLRYFGGETRVLSVDRSISFSELMVKLGEMYGSSVNLRCQLPTEDLDALISITSGEDLINIIEEYDRAVSAPPSSAVIKIRAFLSPPKSAKKPTVSPPPSTASASSSATTSPKSLCSTNYASPRSTLTTTNYHGGVVKDRCIRQTAVTRSPAPAPAVVFPACYEKAAGKCPQYGYHGVGHVYLIHHGNHWQ